MFTTPITNILNFTETFQKAIAGFRRFCDVLDTRPDIEDKPGALDLAVSEGAICYRTCALPTPVARRRHPWA